MSIFGDDKVIKAAACFGKGALRRTDNFVWFLKFEDSYKPGRDSIRQDLARGQRILGILERRNKPPSPPRWVRTAHDDGGFAPRSGTIHIDETMNYGWGDVIIQPPDDDGPRAA